MPFSDFPSRWVVGRRGPDRITVHAFERDRERKAESAVSVIGPRWRVGPRGAELPPLRPDGDDGQDLLARSAGSACPPPRR